jgi:hypothetical protein
MGALLELARAVMTIGAHPVAEIDGEDILIVEGVGERDDLTVYAHAREDDDQLVVYAVWPGRAAPDVRPAMAEFFTRANWALAVGNFELDLDNGEMRFKVGIDAEGGELRAPLVQQMLRTVIAAMETFATGIDRVLAGETQAERILLDLADD